jgi:hypothetical protein
MPKRLLFSLSIPWLLLWLMISVLEIAPYIHDPARPRWQAATLLASSLLAAIAALACWFKSGAFQRITLEDPSRWLIPATAWSPAYAGGMLALVYGSRWAVFALAGAEYQWTPSDTRPVYLIIKVTVFYALWIGLAFGARMVMAMREPNAKRAGPERLMVPVGDKQRLIETGTIQWLEADDNYVRIHTGAQDYAVRKTLQDLLSELGSERFVRIHRSAAVNLTEIHMLQSMARGDAEIMLKNGAKLRVSRRFRQELQSRITS